MVCSKADTAFDTNLSSTSEGVKLVIVSRKSSRRAMTLSLVVCAIAGTMVGAMAHLPAARAAEQANNLSGEVQLNVFDSEEERNQFILDLALKSPDKGANHILVHENVSHVNGEKERALAASIAAPSISNFDIVSEGLWRGAAPSNQAMQKLAESGVKTIVDLRLAGLGAEEEASRAKKLGIKYIHIPLGFMGPSLSKVAQFLNIVNDPANQPVFVHCRYGADRTGALVGVFRVIHDHWSFNQAYSEMRSHHFKPWLASLKRVVARVGGNVEVQQELKTLANKNLASTNL
jgi:tyrosine-protein phosphatase SIW14